MDFNPMYGVIGDRYDRSGAPHMQVGTFETDDYQEARDKAYDYASPHPNAVARNHEAPSVNSVDPGEV
jgi:hypothetical protein